MGSSIDDHFDQKMKNHYEKLQKYNRHKSADETKKQRLQEIEKIVILYTYKYGGITLGRLASLTGLDRRAMEPYLTKLLASKEIQRKGKKGKFSSITVNSSDFHSSSFALSQMFMSLYKIKAATIIDNDYYQLHFNDTTFEKKLFELSNKIGAYMIFLFIESMNPNNKYIPDEKYDDLLSGDSLSIAWLGNSFSPIIDSLIREFRDIYLSTLLEDRKSRGYLIDLGLYALGCRDCNEYAEHYSKSKLWEHTLNHIAGHHQKWYKVETSGLRRPINKPTIRELYEQDHLTLTKELIGMLKQKFNSVYPILSDVFEKFMQDVPDQIQFHNKQWQDHLEYDELNEIDRIRCKHHYSETLTVGKYQYKECSKCHMIIPKKL